MKKILLTSVCGLVLAASNIAYGLAGEGSQNGVSIDAFSSLKATQCMVYADLEKNMQTFLYSMPNQNNGSFGIDDTGSYAQKQEITLGSFGVEG